MPVVFTHQFIPTLIRGGVRLKPSKTYSASYEVNLAETIANGSTDFSIPCALDVSAVKSIWISCDVAVTVETNSGSAPDNTLVLKAGIPYIWNTDSYDTFKLTADVTSLKITNASGSAASLLIHAIQDATP